MDNHDVLSILDFYHGRPGDVCSHEDQVIRSHKECETAAQILGFPKSRVNNWFGNHMWIPAGCSVRKGQDHRLHFEESPEGVGRGRQDLIPLCRKAFSSIGMDL